LGARCLERDIRLVYARPGDGASKGKIERFWRTLRGHVLDRLAPGAVETIDDLNLRLMTWVNSEYNVRPHSGLSGQTPLSVFEEDADEIRFIRDVAEIESNFVAHVERTVKNDSTCSVAGRVYEVPAHLRRGKVTLYYEVLRPDTLWLEDGGVRVPVREVDAIGNSHRPRLRRTELPPKPPKPTGLNAVEGILGRALRPKPPAKNDDGNTNAKDDRGEKGGA